MATGTWRSRRARCIRRARPQLESAIVDKRTPNPSCDSCGDARRLRPYRASQEINDLAAIATVECAAAKGEGRSNYRTAQSKVYGQINLYWQLGNLNEAICVLQLKVPLLFRYSVVYQKVQSSVGSRLILE